MDDLQKALAQLADQFRARCVRGREELEDLIRTGQVGAPQTRLLLHGLAGAGGTFGFPEITVCARAAERAVAAGAPASNELQALIAALERCPAPDMQPAE